MEEVGLTKRQLNKIGMIAGLTMLGWVVIFWIIMADRNGNHPDNLKYFGAMSAAVLISGPISGIMGANIGYSGIKSRRAATVGAWVGAFFGSIAGVIGIAYFSAILCGGWCWGT